jgi:hypothetical protein
MRTSIAGVARLLSAFVFTISSSAAADEELGVVAVAEPPGPTPELAELTHQLRLVAAERTAGVVSADDLRERMTGQTSSATLSELDRAYAGALATYQNGDFEGAVRTLRAVVEDLERLPPSAEAFGQWTRAMLRLARAEQTLGRGGEAREALERLVRANPAAKADPNQYPPSFVKQVAEAKAEVGKLGKRKLAIAATARGARIFVEGREIGTAPITVDLPPGRYRVAGVHGNTYVPAVVADLTEEGQSISLNFALAEALRPRFGPGLALAEEDRARDLVAAGNWLGVDKLVATRMVSDAGVEYLAAGVFDVRRGMLLREGRIRLANKIAPAGSLSALASFLITGQASTLVAQVDVAGAPARPAPAVEPVPRAEPAAAEAVPTKSQLEPAREGKEAAAVDVRALLPPREPERTGVATRADLRSRRKWAYISGGAGLALLAGGAVAGLQARSAYDDEKSARTLAAYDDSKSKAKTMSLVADALFVTGGAGLAVGSWLFFTSRSAPLALEVEPVPGGAVAFVAGGF